MQVNEDKHEQDSEGVVIVLLALLLFVFVGFLAMSLDTLRLSVSSSKQDSTANLAALSALEAFAALAVDTSLSESAQYDARLQAAVDRAEEIIGSAKNTLMTQQGVQTDAAADELAESTGRLGRTNNVIGEISAGQYYFAAPMNDCSTYTDQTSECPCPNGEWKGPCFRKNESSDLRATAFEIVLMTKQESPLGNVFGKVLSNPSYRVHSKARAAFLPSAGVFALDLSPSTTFETHLPLEALPSAEAWKASQYAFKLSSPAACGAAGFCKAGTGGKAQPCTFASANAQAVFYGMTKTRNTANTYACWRHFQSDYTCHSVTMNGNTENYLIDTNTHACTGGYYYGPEPLYSILAGIHAALHRLETRAFAGDSITLMGFDDTPLGRTIGPTYPGHADFTVLKQLTDTRDCSSCSTTASEATLARIAAGFVPRGDVYTDISAAVLEAEKILGRMSGDINATRFVTMITDGLANCAHWVDGDWWKDFLTRDENGEIQVSTPSCIAPAQAPNMEYHPNHVDYHLAGLNEAAALVSGLTPSLTIQPGNPEQKEYYYYVARHGQPTYVHQKIMFNAVLFGAQPHTLMRNSEEPGKCMTDEESRRIYAENALSYDPDNVWKEDNSRRSEWVGSYPHESWLNNWCYYRVFSPTTGTCPYYTHHDMFYRAMVRPTGGYYLPIRKPCDMNAVQSYASDMYVDEAACKNGDFRKKLDTLCQDPYWEWPAPTEENPDATERLYEPPVYHEGLLNAGVFDNWICSKLDESGNVTDCVVTWEDGEGEHSYVANKTDFTRLACDPQCRTTEEQFVDLINQIYAEKPYILVDERNKNISAGE